MVSCLWTLPDSAHTDRGRQSPGLHPPKLRARRAATACTCVQAVATEHHAAYSTHAVFREANTQTGFTCVDAYIKLVPYEDLICSKGNCKLKLMMWSLCKFFPPWALGKHGSAFLQGSPLGRVWGKLLHHSLHSVNTSHVHLHHMRCCRLSDAENAVSCTNCRTKTFFLDIRLMLAALLCNYHDHRVHNQGVDIWVCVWVKYMTSGLQKHRG